MLLVACGTSKNLQNASITVQTLPKDAKVYVNGTLVSLTTPAVINVPASVSSSSSSKGNLSFGKVGGLMQGMIQSMAMGKEKTDVSNQSDILVRIEKDGYETIQETITPKVSGKQLVWPTSLVYELKERNSAYKKDPTIPAGAANERVTRDTSGNTSLERTIIRWFFDSDPQGARIYWRVISSVPAEVKNTNELWLGSTPFEETRAFNIQGLTYENSRDVQIEIKVKRKGYIDQNKRFNVRQAIDQQEISSFFDMVKE